MSEFSIGGDSGAISQQAQAFRTRAGKLFAVADHLDSLAVPGWQGSAAEHFRDLFASEPARWRRAGEELLRGAEALELFAEHLRSAQGRAEQLHRQWVDVSALSVSARAEYDADVTRLESEKLVWEATHGPGTYTVTMYPFADPSGPLKDEISTELRTLRAEFEAAAAQCAASLRQQPESTAPIAEGQRPSRNVHPAASWQSHPTVPLLQPGLTRQAMAEHVAALWTQLRQRPEIFDPAVLLDHETWVASPAGAAARYLPSELVAMAVTGMGVTLSRETATIARLIPPADRFSSYLNRTRDGSTDDATRGSDSSLPQPLSSRLRTDAGAVWWAAPNHGRVRAVRTSTRAPLTTPEPDPRVGDGIDVATGAVVLGDVDVHIEGAVPVRVTRVHRSTQAARGLLGPGWTTLFDARLEFSLEAGSVRFLDGDGGVSVFDPSEETSRRAEPGAGGWWSARGRRLVLLRAEEVLSAGGVPAEFISGGNGFVVVDPLLGRSWLFSPIADPDAAEPDQRTAVLTGSGDDHGHWYAIDRDPAGVPVQVRTSGGAVILVQTASVRVPSAPAGRAARIIGLHLVSTNEGVEVASEPPVQTLVRYGYDDVGVLAAVLDPQGRAMHYDYELPDGAPSPDSDVGTESPMRIAAWTDRNGSRYEYGYDSAGQCIRGRGTEGMRDVTIAYAAPSGTAGDALREVTDSLGVTREYWVNAHDQVVRYRDALGRNHFTQWDECDRPLELTDAAGHVTRFSWNQDGALVRIEAPGSRRWTVEWAAVSQPALVTAPDGTVVQYRYNQRGNLIEISAPDDAVWLQTFDRRGRNTGYVDPTGVWERYELDDAGLPIRLTRGADGSTDAITRFDRDGCGRVLRIVDATGAPWSFTRDEIGRLLHVHTPDGAAHGWVWDGEGNLLEYVDPMGRATRMTYTVADQVASVTRPDGSVTVYRYDTEGRIAELIDPMGRAWQYVRDAEGRVIAEIDVNGSRTEYERDVLGRVVRRRNAVGQTATYGYTEHGTIETISGEGVSIRYRYDELGRLIGATTVLPLESTANRVPWWRRQDSEPEAEPVLPTPLKHEITRDAMGRVVAESWNELQVKTRRDAAGRPTARTTSGGAAELWSYAVSGQPKTAEWAGHHFAFTHDPVGREVDRRVDNAVAMRSVFSTSGRLEERGFEQEDQPPLWHERYEYDMCGAVIAVNDTSQEGNERREFVLDAMHRVLTLTVKAVSAEPHPDTGTHRDLWWESYRYDGSGMLSAAAHGVGTLPTSASGDDTRNARERTEVRSDRQLRGSLVTRIDVDLYEYDQAGRLVSVRRPRPDQTQAVWTFEYDALDRLIALTTPQSRRWRYAYDGLQRRILRSEHEASGGTVAEHFALWDGPAVIETITRADADESVVSWLRHPADGQLLAQVTRGADERQFHLITTDIVGTPTRLWSPGASAPEWRSRTGLWGEPMAAASADPARAACALRFPGQIHDPESGMNYNVNRYYNPASAAYVTPDPLGAGPGVNPHAYVANPICGYDVLGLTPHDRSVPTDDVPDGAASMAGHVHRFALAVASASSPSNVLTSPLSLLPVVPWLVDLTSYMNDELRPEPRVQPR